MWWMNTGGMLNSTCYSIHVCGCMSRSSTKAGPRIGCDDRVINWLACVQERQFLEKQAADMENAMKRLSEQHREKVALYEKQYLQQKHQLKRGTV